MRPRRLKRGLRLRGRGLFTGGPVAAVIEPTHREGWWIRSDRGVAEPITPRLRRALPRRSCLELSSGSRVELVEHLLAALLLSGVRSALLRIEGGEVPILDGSALPWLRALRAASIPAPLPPLPQLQVAVRWRGDEVVWSATRRGDTDALDVACARTFIEVDEARQALRAGLFPGARPGSAVVLTADGALRGGRPRVPAEQARHKLLDLIGDLAPYAARAPLEGALRVDEPGHARNGPAIEAALRRGDLRAMQAR